MCHAIPPEGYSVALQLLYGCLRITLRTVLPVLQDLYRLWFTMQASLTAALCAVFIPPRGFRCPEEVS